MKITIITPTYNSSATIAQTLESITKQSHPDKEHLVIDGGSTDDTLAIVRAYAGEKPYVKILSEKDDGLYDAMNKGIAQAAGDVIHILNSDDFYEDETVLEKVAAKFKTGDVNALYGDLILVNRDDITEVTRLWRAGDFHPHKIENGWSPPHPALFVKKEIYQTVGNFSLDFKIASDYDFMLRMMRSPETRFGYIPDVLVRMRNAGISNNSIIARIKGWQELRKSWTRSEQTVPPFFILRRIASKIPQYFFFRSR